MLPAMSNVSTGSKLQDNLLTTDDVPTTISWMTDGDPKLVELQLLSSALEFFAHGRYRSDVVHGTTQESMLRLWHYDCVEIVKSENVDVLNTLLELMLIHFTMSVANLTDKAQSLRPAVRYSSPAVTLPTRSLRPRAPSKPSYLDNRTNTSSDDGAKENSTTDPDSAEFSTPQLDPVDPFVGAIITVDGQSFILGPLVSRQYVIGGATCVMDTNDGTAVVKPSRPDKARTLEYGSLDEAYNCAQPYVDRKCSSIMAHLAGLLKSEDLDTTSLLQSWIRHALPQESDFSREILHVLRVTVDKKLLPMTEIRIADDFKNVMWDVVRRHRSLHKVVGILQRDVSLNNVIFYQIDSTIVCVPVNFDLEQDVTKRSYAMFDRTGIPIVMAIDCLEDSPMLHLARHDFESMLWVMVWFTCRYENGRENPYDSSRSLEKWIMNHRDLQKYLPVIKRSFLMKEDGNPTSPFETIYEERIVPLLFLFMDGYMSLDRYQRRLRVYNRTSGTPHQGPPPDKPFFGPDQLFYDHATVWTAFWKILNPSDPID
ncbi:hypothetical protein BS47DRAFT_1433080 [Hydnum rufescens UP504]|uniref:Fungal-type protein kinase domain-containing protein n=1 Tax=Hydnum rufescens UP504 TaxID=1448309 RepID=A0A9P6DPJ2_9AGAM|nr:hypothetical protein BS47DRAFT_1433080 [Hydnum rufescens UP504]